MPARTNAPTHPPTRRSTFTGVKTFGATMSPQRHALGETVTQWLAAHPEITVVDIVVAQSSDAAFHCVSICIFFLGELAAAAGRRR